MSDDVQAQLDDFERELTALARKFEALQRQVVHTPAETPSPVATPAVPAWLQRLDELFRSGAHDEALRMVEWNLEQRLITYSELQLVELREYLHRVETPEQSRRNAMLVLIAHELGSRRAPKPAATSTAYPAPERTPPREPRKPRPAIELEDILGPRALAIAGGIVTVLGIVFFFVLAVNRGWIGPHTRVALGAIAAALVFGAGLELKRRYGPTYSTLAAVGAGIAGGYATLLSAATLYHFLSDWSALVVAVVIAVVGLATAVAWRSEIVGGIGLLGAMLIPAFIEAQGGVSVLATSFVAVVFAVLAVSCISMGWRILLVAGALGSAPQLLALAFQPGYRHESPVNVIAVVAVFFVLYVAAGVVLQLRVTSTRVDPFATPFILGAGLIAGGSLAWLLATNEQRGVALMILAGVYVLPGAFFFTRSRTRDLSSILTFATFTLMAIGFALLLHGDAVAYAWAAEAAGVAWLARTVREFRFQLWSGAYLVLALIHSLFDAPPRHLDYPGLNPDALTAHPASGVGTVVAVAVAAAVFSFYARPWSEADVPAGERLRDEVYRGFAEAHRSLRLGAAWLALALATFAASLGMLAHVSSFTWATAGNAVIWMAIGLVLLGFGFRRGLEHLRLGAVVWLGLTALLALVQASRFLVENPRTVAVAAVGVAALVASFAYGMSRNEGVDREPVMSTSIAVISLVLLVYPIVYRLDDGWEGAAFLGLAAAYALLSAALGRREARDPSTVYWAIAIGLAAVADVLLLHATFQVLGWAAAGVAIGWLARRVREPRLYLGGAALVALALAQAFVLQAPPRHLFVTLANPAYGTASIFVAAAAVAALAYFARAELGRLGRLRTAPRWLAGGLAVYGLSLLILDLVERISDAPELYTEFQRGQTAVSAFWGLLGLGLLYVGLKRRSRPLRIAGLAFFPISLAKIFLFDLPSLSSVTRALSFLAVGGVLLLGGFFYQRLMSARDETPPATSPPA
ncbi:MAG: hypothetical protein QOG85_2515 [Gaiellaceae bacterium]|jgi:hypothetical protein|nr:hypothetical protein [Gaiellaceae bacterium]